jgi:hypothetical protein
VTREPAVRSAAAPWRALFVPVERLGWAFVGQQRTRRQFDEPEPQFGEVLPGVEDREKAAAARLGRGLIRMWWAAAGGGLVGVAWQLRQAAHHDHASSVRGLILAAGLGVGAALLWCAAVVGVWWWTCRRLRRIRATHMQSVTATREQWQQRAERFAQAESARLTALPDWDIVGVAPASRRLDVVGGNGWSREALLTVFGASAVTARGPMTILDLSRELVVRELVRGAAASGVGVDFQLLPNELADSDLLVGMGPEELAEAVVAAVHGDGRADRGEREMDTRVARAVCQTLHGGGLSMARVSAGLRVLMGEPVGAGELSLDERTRLMDGVFSEHYRREAFTTLRRMEALVHPLAELGTRTATRPAARLRAIALPSDWISGSSQFLADLLVAWAARRILSDPEKVATLVIVGADELSTVYLDRLTDLCERRGVRLVTMFHHLRETVATALGAGPVGFLRLGNPAEAERAADFIGREHRFVISQLTQTLGGEQTHSLATSDGTSDGGSRSRTSEHGHTTTGSGGGSWGASDTCSWNTERTWSRTATLAQGASWSSAQGAARVYEYTVDPRTLQQLPDYLMVLVDHAPGGPRLQAVEINPEIALLQPANSSTLADADQDSTMRLSTEQVQDALTGQQRSQLGTNTTSDPSAWTVRRTAPGAGWPGDRRDGGQA